MTAARWHGRREIRIERVPVPEPAPDEALVAVEWVGLCGSDLEEYTEGPVVARPPVTLGHEIVGRVAVPARDGSGPGEGTPVVVDVVTGCGDCRWCREHREGLCPRLIVTGQHRDGGLAEYVVGRAARLIPLPPTLSERDAVLAEPLAVAVRAIRAAGDVGGADAVVVGGGTIGILCGLVARDAGADRVVVLEPKPRRGTLLADLGLLPVWAESAAGRAEAVAALVDPSGPAVVVECSGRGGMAAEAIALVRRGGTTVLLGVVARPEPIDVLDVVLAEKTVRGSAAHMWDDDVAPAVGLLAARIVDARRLVTHTVDLEDVRAGFEILESGPSDLVKLAVRVGAHG